MLFSILAAVFFSTFSFLSFLCDTFFPRIYFRQITVITFIVLALFYKPACALIKTNFSLKTRLFLLGIFLLSFCYFIFPSLPDLFPLSLSWDGANHIALVNYLRQHSSHIAAFNSRFNLPWGGYLYTYPWGMHAIYAGLFELLGINTVFIIYPFTCFLSALIIMSLASYFVSYKFNGYSIILTLCLILFSRYGFFYLIKFNHWSQVIGTLLCLSLIYTLEYCSEKNQAVGLPVILLIGIFMIYPIFAAILWPGLVYVLIKKKYRIPNLLIILISPALIGLVYALVNGYPEIINTVLAKTGSLGLNTESTVAGIIIYLLSLPGAVYLILRRKKPCFIFSLIAALIISLASLLKVTFAYKLNWYWVWKIASLNLILLAPALCFLLSNFFVYFRKLLAGRKTSTAATVLACIACLVVYPKSYIWSLQPAFQQNEYLIWKEAVSIMGNRRVFYVSRGHKKIWLKAVLPEINLELPYYKNNPGLIIMDNLRYDPRIQFFLLIRSIKPGDLIITNEKELLLDKRFMPVSRKGDLVLWILKNPDEDNNG